MKKFLLLIGIFLFVSNIVILAQIPRTDTTIEIIPTRILISNFARHAVIPPDQQEIKPNATIEYKAQVISTNFTIPIIRFNIIDKKSTNAPKDRKGNVSFFNSVGAGIGYYWGRITDITDKDANVVNSEMDNTFGIQVGFLFASNSSGSNNTNIFAITSGISILNFQLGYGYEFGTIGANDKRGFMTLAYGIPISKLIRGGFYKVKSFPELTGDQKRNGFTKF